MQKIPLFIDQTGGISIAQLSARARRLKRQRGLDLDRHRLYPADAGLERQVVAEPRAGNQPRSPPAQSAGQGTGGADHRSVAAVASVESRDDKRPQLSDLRESGSIEQDADVVMFVYREEYYLKNREPKLGTEEYVKWENEMNEMRGKAEVIVAKQRHGPTGSVTLAFQGEFTRFSDLAEEHHIAERFE